MSGTGREYHLGVLFVHGIGDRPEGATLVSSATPVVEWLAARAGAVGGSAQVTAADLTPGGTPAFASLRIATSEPERRWLLAEAWWDASFATPRFGDLARWATGVVPWTFGSHFGATLRRRSQRTGQHPAMRWISMAAAFLQLTAALVISVIVQLAMWGLLVLGLIPWDRLRAAIARLQSRLAASVGDSYVLITSPIEGAAIIDRFRRDLSWMEARCDRVAIVAHSQGGAVACLGVLDRPKANPRLLLTFGSGLRKLEELKALRAHPSLRRGALLASIGLVFAGLATAGVYFGLALLVRGDGDWQGLLTLLVVAAVGWILTLSGLRDFMDRSEPKDLRSLCTRIAAAVDRWVDVYSTGDPVANGPLHDAPTDPPLGVPVTNSGSPLRDHVLYWRNRDEFVTLVCEELLAFDGGSGALRLDEGVRSALRQRQRARVGLQRVASLAAIASTVVLIVAYAPDWWRVTEWTTREGTAALANIFGWRLERVPVPNAVTWGRSVGWLGLSLTAYSITLYILALLRRRDALHLTVIQGDGEWRNALGLSLTAQMMAAAGALGLLADGGWFMAIFMAALFISVAATLRFQSPHSAQAQWPEPAPQPTPDMASAEQSARTMGRMFYAIAVVLGLFIGVTGGVRDTGAWLERMLGREVPWPATVAFLLAAFTLAGIVLVAVVSLVARLRRSRGPTSSPSA